MKQFFHYFRFLFITIAALAVFLGALMLLRETAGARGGRESANTERKTTERVFDYADKLTDKEEAKLRKLIAKRERQAGCDIVLVTLEEPLAEYALPYEEQLGKIYVDEYVTVYADNFYDENCYGYDEPYGDGAIFVDNYAREADGKRYMAFSTSGRVEASYSDDMIDYMFDKVLAQWERSPYRAYKTYINTLYYDMAGHLNFTSGWGFGTSILVSLIIMTGFILYHLTPGRAKKTTTATTYVRDGVMDLKQKEDMLINKTVTRRHIETSGSGGGGSRSGSSGGGGHHTSSGGHSHGGGSRGH